MTVPSAPITIGITVTFMFHSFFLFLCLGLGTYLFFRFPSVLSRGQPERQSSLFGRFSSSFFFLLTITRSDPFVSPNPKEFCMSHFQGRIYGCAYSICSYGQIIIIINIRILTSIIHYHLNFSCFFFLLLLTQILNLRRRSSSKKCNCKKDIMWNKAFSGQNVT